MTNSIATAKCPTVLSSGNYGMSQSCYTDESKEYIFVKLTDSAFRAIEEYQRNEHAQRFNVGQNAKIQFSGNKGILHFPTPEADAEGRQFGFAIDELEGSLECLHQSQHQLDVLGALAYRMRIHANDDVYDTTRTKMAIAEETEKSKCIREIKPNQTDIGRKVKKSLTNLTNNSSSSSSNNNNNSNNNSSNNNSNSNYLSNRSKLTATTNSKSPTASKSPNPLVNSSSCNISNGNSNNNQQHQQQHQQHVSNSLGSSAASTLFAQFANSISNGYAEMGTPPATAAPVATAVASIANTTASKTNKVGSGFGSRANNKTAFGKSGNSTSNSKLPDISRRKIRERLIHLLALKPFKKPELYARLQNEGLRDRERPLISNILKDISTLSRDNTFNLKRQMWNDVNENWPYYTEQELQQLKRRKPQNLTPPLSSDAGSSTSGQSPTSIHTGSPPPLVGNGTQIGSNAIAGNNNTKRSNLEASGSNYEDNFLGVQPKKQRISHFKKDPGPGAVAAVNQRYGATFRPATSSVTVSSAYSGSGPNATGTGRNATKHRAAKSPSVAALAASHEANEPISTDLSFNVLDNVDELMPQMLQEQHNSSLFNSQRKNISANNNKNNNNSNNNIKEKSRSSNNNSNNYNNSNNNSSSKNNDAKCNTDMSAKPYVNFVPEKRKQQQKQQVPVPAPQQHQQQQQQQQSASLIKSLNTNNSSNSSSKTSGKLYSPNRMDDMQQFTNNSSNNINNNNNVSSFHSNSPIGRSNSLSGKNRYSQQQQQQQPQQPQQQQHKNMRQHQQQQTQANLLPPPAPTNTTTIAAAIVNNNNNQQQQQPQQNYSSPTQQIAAAASTYATTSLNETMPRQKYDFSQYTPITSIEQRRKYKTEFEADYDEYLKLLAQIEGVGKRFRALADQLENARQGCADYYEIKQKILIEYERIRNEDSLKRDKQRFDYLHEKLAHIKQLVADYDKTLTDAAVAQAQAAAVAAQQQQQQQQIYEQRRQQQQSQRLSPMVMSGGESNQSPPMQYQQMLMQQQHHSAETIQLQQQAQQQQSITSNNTARQSPQMNIDYALYVQQQKQHAQQQQQLQNQQQQQQQQQQLQQQSMQDKQADGLHNTVHIHNSDSDSSSSSDDDDDDDQSNDDDDDSNSNDDD